MVQPVLKSEFVRQRDAWFSAIVLFAIPVGFILILFVAGREVLTEPRIHLLLLIMIIFTEILVLLYCMGRYGKVELGELLPRGSDYLVLLLALLILFWPIGLTVGGEGLRSGTYNSISKMPGWQYWATVFILLLFGPFLEESFFRRYFLEILRAHYPISVAVLLTAMVATIFHLGGSISSLLWMFFDQLVLTVAYVKSRLGVSVIVHWVLNSLIFFLSR